jgi:acid phosphatase (class A)
MKRLPLLLLLAFVSAALAPAQPVRPPGTDKTLLGHPLGQWPGTAALDLPTLLPPPPAAGSPTERVELDQVLAAQAARTPEQAARCVQIENETLWLFGSEVLGPWFTEANLPKTAAFFARVRADFIPVNRAAKALHPRKRPPFADDRIKPCVEFADTGAYPSGHGIQSSLWAGLLGEIFPDKANDFLLRAATTRNFKFISGVHFPSDLAAGQAVGEAMARALLTKPAVQQAIAELRAEAAAHSAKN